MSAFCTRSRHNVQMWALRVGNPLSSYVQLVNSGEMPFVCVPFQNRPSASHFEMSYSSGQPAFFFIYMDWFYPRKFLV